MSIEYIPRLLERDIEQFIRSKKPHKEVLLVEGARQVGKTFLVEHILQKVSNQSFVVNFEREARMRSLIDECVDFQEFEELLKDRLGFGCGPVAAGRGPLAWRGG
jgi:predicted AAA+ superfamily ATPase